MFAKTQWIHLNFSVVTKQELSVLVSNTAKKKKPPILLKCIYIFYKVKCVFFFPLQRVSVVLALPLLLQCTTTVWLRMASSLKRARAGMTAAGTVTAMLEGRCVSSSPALHPAAQILCSGHTSAVPVARVCINSAKGWHLHYSQNDLLV